MAIYPWLNPLKKNNFHEGRLLEFQFLQIHRFHLSTAGMRFTTGRVEIPIDIQELHLPKFGVWGIFGGFLKWWYTQNTPKWSFLVGKPMVVGYHHFREPPFGGGPKSTSSEEVCLDV